MIKIGVCARTPVDYYIGKTLPKHRKTPMARKLLWLSIGVNLGLLFYFKYYNFFVGSLIAAFSTIGIHLHASTLNIILPVGISFYTFQTMSYTIDIYRNRIRPTESKLVFYSFVSFFPQLVAGPIERASALIPQFEKARKYSYANTVDGLRFILYGLFKKMVIADSVAVYADEIVKNYSHLPGSDLFLGIHVFFAVQFYCDYSGYTDIAIGSAKLFGFELSRNFAYPQFSRSIREFWNRWNITLSNWFRDYVLIGLLRSRWKNMNKLLMVIIMFSLIGLWHGASYTFIIVGILNGIWFATEMKLTELGVIKQKMGDAQLKDIGSIALLLTIAGFLMIIFRSPSLSFAFDYFRHLFTTSLFSIPSYSKYLFWPIVLVLWEWNFRHEWHGLALDHWKPAWRWGLYLLMTLMIIFNLGEVRDFYYYQF